MSKFYIFYIEVIILVVIPILLLTAESSMLAIRPYLMIAGGIYCAIRLLKSEATLASLGVHQAKFKTALVELIKPSFWLVTIILLLFLMLPLNYLKILVGYDPLSIQSFSSRIISYIFISAPVQELIFRGYLTWRIKQVFTDPQKIEAISIGIFTFAHIPFYSPLMLIIAFFMGLMYIRNYLKHGNLFAPIISHSLVGAILIVIRNAWFPYS